MVEMKREQEKHKNFISSFLVIWRLWRLLPFGQINLFFRKPFRFKKSFALSRLHSHTQLTRAPSSLEKKHLFYSQILSLLLNTHLNT